MKSSALLAYTDVVYRVVGPLWRALPFHWRRAPIQFFEERILGDVPHGILNAVVTQLKLAVAKTNQPVFFTSPTYPWNHAGFQRPHQIARAVAEEGCASVFAEPFRGDPLLVRSADGDLQDLIGAREVQPNLFLVRLPEYLLMDLLGTGLFDGAFMHWPFQEHLFQRVHPRTRVIYEMVDDHSLVQQEGKWFTKAHQHWVRKCDVMSTTAECLRAELSVQRPDVLSSPNGVRLCDWRKEFVPDVPADLQAARKAPVLVHYHGALARWFDWDLLLGAAAQRPDWSFVIIGFPFEQTDEEIRNRIAAAKNVYYLGPKPHEELAAYVAHSNVTCIPFLLNAVTHACSPVKLFEYMAAGKPTVAAPMREILRYKSVFPAGDAEAFVRQAEAAMQAMSHHAFRAELHAEAEANTWRRRARDFIDAVERLRPGKEKAA